jgi:hypothetical protein
MSNNRKFINIHEDVLIEWIYDNGNITEDYTIWTNLQNQSRNFVSKSSALNNIIDYTLFNVDPVLKKYTKVDTSKFNFLKTQDYFTAPIQYDKVNIHFPFNYDFDDYIGFLMKIYCYDFDTDKLYWFANYYYDKSDTGIQHLMQIEPPFRYGEREWGKYLTFSIPSIDAVSEQRIISGTANRPIADSINENITFDEVGLGVSTPIFIDFSFITSKEFVLNTYYFYLGDTFETSISKTAEYQSLGVVIEESTNWDFFEIYGVYDESNENLDNFIRSLEEKGRKINIDYIVTLYEENIQSGFPIKFNVTENFAQKIEYRPIFKYSNTTAAIDVEMQIIDLVDNSTIIRTTSLGLRENLFKYGKKLSSINIATINKPIIYNYRGENYVSNPNLKATTSYGITKVPYPILINNYKILLNSSRSTVDADEYKTMGTLTILLTPFDNVIKFRIARQLKEGSTPEPYDMSEILINSRLTLVFKSDTQMIEKEIFHESDENNIKLGTVLFKVKESDMKSIKQMYENDFDNFYITIVGNDTRTLLYSGKIKIFEDVKFLDLATSTIRLPENEIKTRIPRLKSGIDITASRVDKRYAIDDKVERKSAFKEENLPIRPVLHQNELDYYRNLIVYMNQNLSTTEISAIKNQITSLGLTIYYEYDNTIVLERVHLNKIKSIEDIGNVDNVIKLKLNLGWGTTTPTTPNLTIKDSNSGEMDGGISLTQYRGTASSVS